MLGILPGIIALLQATETVKLLTGMGESLAGRLLLFDALLMEFSEFKLRKDPKCPVCGEDPTVTELIDYQGFCGLPSSTDGDRDAELVEVSAFAVNLRRSRGEDLFLLDVRDEDEFERARIEGATLIPVDELGDRIHELADWTRRNVVVHCHHGPRSQRAVKLLLEHGFAHVESMAGGIEAWSLTVDPEVPRY